MKKQNIDFLPSLKQLFRQYPIRTFLIILLSLISGFAEGLGIASILPMLTIITESTSAEIR